MVTVSDVLWYTSKILGVYMIISMLLPIVMPASQSNDAPPNSLPAIRFPSSRGMHSNIWREHDLFNLRVWISEEPTFEDYSSPAHLSVNLLSYDFHPGNSVEKDVLLPCGHSAMNNGSLYAHIHLYKNGVSPDPTSKYRKDSVIALHGHRLNVYKPKPKLPHGRRLLVPSTVEDSIQSTDDDLWVSYWRPELRIRLVVDKTVFGPGKMPKSISDRYSFSDTSNRYYPALYLDYFWLLDDKMTLVNETVSELPLKLAFEPISLFKWQMQVQMEDSWRAQERFGTTTSSDTNDFRRMLVESNPLLLAVTLVVTVLHSLFDFLAFKNDVSFWKNRKSTVGLSTRTILINVFCQVVIFLYLLDNDTSWMILSSSFVGLCIEVWKASKSSHIAFFWRWGFIPCFSIESDASDTITNEHDKQAMVYLSYAMYPLVLGYAVYSLYYHNHKSWYSYVLGSLVGSIYMFGFIMMCPQLYLNYKLKSVAHLPWRMLTYKALNTFVDDLFAFIIKMPTLHRLSCFRDDIIFFIFLYQSWIYRVDYKRANEYGYVAEPTPEKPKQY